MEPLPVERTTWGLRTMGCDVVVALGQATVDGVTLFGQNCDQPAGHYPALCRTPAVAHAGDEWIRTPRWELPQARQTYTVLASRPPSAWGYTHGINENHLAVGCIPLRNKIPCRDDGLLGTDLVRLSLERCRTARQAMDLLGSLVERHGQRVWADSDPEDAGDNVFMLADPEEAVVFETAGNHWVSQNILQVRAASNLSTVHQDWDRISRGLSEHVLTQSWWPADGSKLDFAQAVACDPVGPDSALRRWGRATLLLEEQNGRLDATCLRRMLCDHYEGTLFEVDPLARLNGPVPLCCHGHSRTGRATAASFVTSVGGKRSDRLPISWCAFGPPCLTAYIPVFLEGDLPSALTSDGIGLWTGVQRLIEQLFHTPQDWARLRDEFARLQAIYDQEAVEFAIDGAALKARGATTELERLAGLYMQHAVEQFETVLSGRNLRFGRRPESRRTGMAVYHS